MHRNTLLSTHTMARFFAALFLVAGGLCAVQARGETNGERMARGLPPLPPRWVPTRTRGAGVASVSSRPSQLSVPMCRAGSASLCCTSVVPASDATATFLLQLLAPPNADHGLIAITCAPLRSETCARQAVCCDNDDFDGVIATGCALRPRS